MQCAVRRWGPGTTCERPINSDAAKELQEKLAKMNQERLNQDKMWNDTTNTTEVKTELKPINKNQSFLVENVRSNTSRSNTSRSNI
jgi:hypothetical protein